MSKKRPERPGRAERREQERRARQLVQDRERLFLLGPGGSAERPIEVAASSVIEPRAASIPCPQCEGRSRIDDHQAPSASLRVVTVTCVRCGSSRGLWFRLAPPRPN